MIEMNAFRESRMVDGRNEAYEMVPQSDLII